MSAIGMSFSPNKLTDANHSNTDKHSTSVNNKTINQIMKTVKKIVATHGLDDDEWAQAISSQYFLLALAKKIDLINSDYHKLLNKCLASFNITYTGDYVLDKDKILITPDETSKIVECMKKEDEFDSYYTHSSKTRACNIDSQKMYMNFHYGLLLRIVSSENTTILQVIKHVCLDKLLFDNALDSSNGWYPYRVPWLTARILISMKYIDFSNYDHRNKLQEAIEQAIQSIYQRFDENESHWRSGVGDWVSKWESTALCLEALYEWDAIKQEELPQEIIKAIEYIFKDTNKDEWLSSLPNVFDEVSVNNMLSSVCLASVVYRITRDFFPAIHEEHKNDILKYFNSVVKMIAKNNIGTVRQHCTIPQILYYIVSAFQ